MSRAVLFVLLQFVLFGVFAVLLIAFPVGGGLVLPGFLIVIAAFTVIMLGILEHMRRNAALPNVTPTPNQNVGLIETGVYKWIRHPIYTGVISGVLVMAVSGSSGAEGAPPGNQRQMEICDGYSNEC